MDVATLRRERGSIKSRVTTFVSHLDSLSKYDNANLPPIAAAELNKRMKFTEGLLDSFLQKHDQILSLIDVDLIPDEENKRTEFEAIYFNALARAELLSENPNNTSRSPSAEGGLMQPFQPHFSQQIQLPKINLPVFDGTHDDWLEFRDKYISLIHTNTTISEIQRFHYLKSCLKGEAADILRGLDYSSDNYREAWKLICDRYDSPRVLSHNHIKAIFNIESIQKESSCKLRHLLDNVTKHITALDRLKEEGTDLFETIMIFIISSKFDFITAREWEESQSEGKLPTIDTLKKFIKNKAELLSTLELKRDKSQHLNKQLISKPHSQFTNTNKSRTTNTYVARNSYKCALCDAAHYLRECPDFLQLNAPERYAKIKALNRCVNCLRFGHLTNDCPSTSTCRKCANKHHTLLHFENRHPNQNRTELQPIETIAVAHESVLLSSNATVHKPNMPQILLSTATVIVHNAQGDSMNARVLLDNGSQSNFVTKSFAQKSKLHLSPADAIVSGISSSFSRINHSCRALLTSINSNFEMEARFFVIESITGQLPAVHIDRSSLNLPPNIHLADKAFHIPGPIDMLIGAEHFWSLLSVGQIALGPHKPTLQKTRFGWIVSGMAAGKQTSHTKCHLSQDVLEQTLPKFWEVEEVPEVHKPIDPNNICEQHFKKSTRRDPSGRFIVTIPTKNLHSLGDTREIALKRYRNLERSFHNKPILRVQYEKFMSEYISLGHMSIAQPSNESICYLPHHAVLKESNPSKFRVVFDASAKSSTGISLNDCQEVGPTLQQDLFAILVRFRQHSYVFTADIAKMYRQIQVDPCQTSLQRIFWRPAPTSNIHEYSLNTVTYGTAAASYLAIRCLFQIADDIENEKPDIAEIIRNDFYVDDLLSGANSIEEAKYQIRGLIEALKLGCFELRKWSSNVPGLLENLPGLGNSLDFGANEPSKTLGLIWNPATDLLSYRINSSPIKPITKRRILSCVSQIFDPLGLLSPCTMIAKILMQRLWLTKSGWDESVPLNINFEWLTYHESLEHLNEITLNRHAISKDARFVEIHGFSDASEKALGACIYMRSTDETGRATTALLCAKGKVAPLKTLSIPRLELCAAELLSRLCKKVVSTFSTKVTSITLWCDSTVVLSWLKHSPSELRTFVANRVAKIQVTTRNLQWRHVPSAENPADLISRGVSPPKLKNLTLWWEGPSWLSLDQRQWPTSTYTLSDPVPEIKATTNLASTVNECEPLIEINNYSSLPKLQRVIAYVMRFIQNLRLPKASRNLTNYVTHQERQNAQMVLIKFEQSLAFKNEINRLSRGKELSRKSPLLSLTPFVDPSGILRVGGRLKNAAVAFDKKHPILLPKRGHLTKLIFEFEHDRNFHVGPLGLLNMVRQSYWPIAGKNTAKNTVRKCIVCFRCRPTTNTPQMGQLPAMRVTPAPPFNHCGVDYAGPIKLKTLKGRGGKIYKSYVVVFVCLATKALHFELATELSTDSFMSALRRLIGRRGKPRIMYSDNGTNFVGAAREMSELSDFLKNASNSITVAADNENIDWKFIPKRSPHFGGMWEAGVKSVKHHLRRVIGDQTLTYEQLYTLLVQVEAILNSRPLTPLSSNPNDFSPLTPAHLLGIQEPNLSLAERDYTNAPISSFSRYQHTRVMAQHFWRRWSKEFLNELQQRTKWRTASGSHECKIDDLVLLKDENLPPFKWRMGRITSLCPGKDGITRVANIKTSTGMTSRAIHKVCPLPKD